MIYHGCDKCGSEIKKYRDMFYFEMDTRVVPEKMISNTKTYLGSNKQVTTLELCEYCAMQINTILKKEIN